MKHTMRELQEKFQFVIAHGLETIGSDEEYDL